MLGWVRWYNVSLIESVLDLFRGRSRIVPTYNKGKLALDVGQKNIFNGGPWRSHTSPNIFGSFSTERPCGKLNRSIQTNIFA